MPQNNVSISTQTCHTRKLQWKGQLWTLDNFLITSVLILHTLSKQGIETESRNTKKTNQNMQHTQECACLGTTVTCTYRAHVFGAETVLTLENFWSVNDKTSAPRQYQGSTWKWRTLSKQMHAASFTNKMYILSSYVWGVAITQMMRPSWCWLRNDLYVHCLTQYNTKAFCCLPLHHFWAGWFVLWGSMTVRGYAVQFAQVQDISHLVNVCDTMMPHTDTSHILIYRELCMYSITWRHPACLVQNHSRTVWCLNTFHLLTQSEATVL